MSKNITLEQSLQAYRVMNTPTKYSWKQHWAQEEFDSNDMFDLDEFDKKQYSKRLKECSVMLAPNIQSREGQVCTLWDVVNLIYNPANKNVSKTNRKVIYSTSKPNRPTSDQGWLDWNGFQVIDMDIKDSELAKKIKSLIFNSLCKCNWFVGCTLSASGMGVHVYTKIALSESDSDNLDSKKLIFRTNFRHKYSFIYIVCVGAAQELGYTKDDVIKWIDLHMDHPQQGVFVGYDPHPLINTRFFEDFIYVNFDNVDDIGHPDIDWVTHPDLKQIFKRNEWFSDQDDGITVEVLEKPELEVDTHTKVHYKHFERWRLANTLVALYGLDQGNRYLRMICANSIKDKELQADCITAKRYEKPVDVWAVNRLNSTHGFKIKLNIQDQSLNEAEIFNSMDRIDNPTLIKESNDTKTYNLTKDQYLGNIRWQLLEDVSRITLLEAGAGVGKTEMVKQLVREGKRIVMVMPFTSTIKAKVENDKNWYYSYGNRKVRLDAAPGLALTIDKFSRLTLMEIKAAGYDYIFIDESHLLFMSEYRTVMPKVIEMIRNTEIPIVMMSGTPSGELVFFQDIKHLRVIKEDVRKKIFNVNLVDSSAHLMFHMCRKMAQDIAEGKRILFPSNNGTLYADQIKAGVTYFMQIDHNEFDYEVNLKYYKKSNVGEKFMDDVNFDKSIKDVQILMCTTYLSVGVDILDRYNFSIYFADLFMPQEVEQWANRLRSNDLYINLYVAKNDAEGNSRSLQKYKELNLKLNDDEIKDAHSILRICNDMIERNPIEYRYNSLVSSILGDAKFIEYNETENKYYLNEIAYMVINFERKYRDYVQQLPVLMRGMKAYGYEIISKDHGEFQIEGHEVFRDVKASMLAAYDDRVKLNTQHIEELLEMIDGNNLETYRGVLQGKYDLKKGDDWSINYSNNAIIVKNTEVFDKVIPLFLSFSKHYEVEQIREIFEFCRHKNGAFNFAAIKRFRVLANMVFNDRKNRLDLPIKDFMVRTYEEFGDIDDLIPKKEIDNFIKNTSIKYLNNASTREILIERSLNTVKSTEEKFMMLFKCLMDVSRPNKRGQVRVSKIELFWKEKEENDPSKIGETVYMLDEFLNSMKDPMNDNDGAEIF